MALCRKNEAILSFCFPPSRPESISAVRMKKSRALRLPMLARFYSGVDLKACTDCAVKYTFYRLLFIKTTPVRDSHNWSLPLQ
jgi:hypothetical protein